MKRGNKALGLLLILIGLLSNPWLLSSLFSNDGKITTLAVYVSIILADLLIVLFGVSIWKRGSEPRLNMGLVLVSLWITIGCSVAIDRVYGHFLMPETANLLFPPFSIAKHKTSEFELAIRINNLGFRGSNTSSEKQRKRVLLIGDSFTFGWGVELEQTWPHLLSEQYPNVEFLNLGQGGNHPGDYVQVTKRAISYLNPDMVIVGILQGNDIHQLMRVIEFEESGKPTTPTDITKETVLEKTKRYLGLVFPNFTKRFPSRAFIQQRWQADAKTLHEELNESQQANYALLDSVIRENFEEGLLNPSLIYESTHHPDMFYDAVDTSNDMCKKAMIRLRDHLLEVASLVITNDARLIVVSLPNRPYGFPSEITPLVELGFNTNGVDTLDSDLPTRTAIEQANVTGIYPSFQEDSLFYKHDGHWNASGNRIFAEHLINELEKLPEWKHFLTSSNF